MFYYVCSTDSSSRPIHKHSTKCITSNIISIEMALQRYINKYGSQSSTLYIVNKCIFCKIVYVKQIFETLGRDQCVPFSVINVIFLLCSNVCISFQTGDFFSLHLLSTKIHSSSSLYIDIFCYIFYKYLFKTYLSLYFRNVQVSALSDFNWL